MDLLQNCKSVEAEESIDSGKETTIQILNSILAKIILCLVIFIGMAFFIYGIIYVFDFWPFNIKTKATKSDWFSFIGSYLGAWGTVILGGIAFFQNREYKKLSDETDKRAEELQLEIRNLTEQYVKMTKASNDLLNARFRLIVSDSNYFGVDVPYERLKQFFGYEDLDINISFVDDLKGPMSGFSAEEVLSKYHTVIFAFYNEGEKPIRNIRADEITFNHKQRMGSLISGSIDIDPGKCIICIVAFQYDFLAKMEEFETETMELRYVMNNVIGDEYAVDVDLLFIKDEDGNYDFGHRLSQPYKNISSEND